jgi:hypothetical protein
VQVHLQRVQRQVLASRDFKIMWPAERVGMLLKVRLLGSCWLCTCVLCTRVLCTRVLCTRVL